MCKRLAVVTTHPIQYNAPLFMLLNKRGIIDICVFYTWGIEGAGAKYDPDFKKMVEWDIPLLGEYKSVFVKNVSSKPGSNHFNGIINPDLVEKIDEYKPDAILVYGWAFRSHLNILRTYHKKIPVLFRGDSTLIDDAAWYKKLFRKILLKWVYSYIDVAMYVGKNNFNYFIEYGLQKRQLIFAPHAIDNDRFFCQSEDCKAKSQIFRDELGIEEDDLIILFVGKLEQKKDPSMLLRSFAKAGLSKKIHLVFVGDGKLFETLKANANDSPNVHFLPFQNQQIMPSVYYLADLLVLPSQGPQETWGLCINEAMACEKPVIVSSKCGCAADLVVEGENGFVFEAGNSEQLIKLLQWIGQNMDSLKQMGQKSRQIIKGYSFENVAKAIEGYVLGIHN